jgi:hypothetical protein
MAGICGNNENAAPWLGERHFLSWQFCPAAPVYITPHVHPRAFAGCTQRGNVLLTAQDHQFISRLTTRILL